MSAKKRKFLSKTGTLMLEYVRDACLLAGFFMIGYGLWLIYPPSALIICGAMVLWVGIPPRERRRE